MRPGLPHCLAALAIVAAPLTADAGPATHPVERLAPSSLAPSSLAPSSLALPMPADAPHDRAALAQDAAPPPGPAPGQVSEVLRSLALPGWGQWHGGHRTLGLAFFLVEGAIWTSAAVFVGQGMLRRDAAEETALHFAGIELEAQSDEIRRLVGQFESHEEYNRLVVLREAQQLHFGDPEAIDRFMAENALGGEQSWQWESIDAFRRYGNERRGSDKAFKRFQFALAAAVVNRVASAVVAARVPPVRSEPRAAAPLEPSSRLAWSVAGTPANPEPRLAWVVRF